MSDHEFVINELNPEWLYCKDGEWARRKAKHHCTSGCTNDKHDTSEGFVSEAEFLVSELRKKYEESARRNNERIKLYWEEERNPKPITADVVDSDSKDSKGKAAAKC